MPKFPRRALALLALLAAAGGPHPSLAQHHGTHAPGAHRAGAAAPYAGMQNRRIKALSEQQVDDLRAGRGMSMALPAELNGYPGPAHVLELADALRLTDEQQASTRALFERMQRDARAAGEEVIAAEAALDAIFREKRATPESLSEAIARAAAAAGRLRETHLRYHLEMTRVLDPAQVERYARLRGY